MSKVISTWTATENQRTVTGSVPMNGSLAFSTWTYTISDVNNQAITASGSTFTINYPAITLKRSNTNKQDYKWAAANFRSVLSYVSDSGLSNKWTLRSRFPSDSEQYTWTSLIDCNNTPVDVWRRNDQAASRTFGTEDYFNQGNSDVRSVNFRWTTYLDSGTTNYKNEGLFSRISGSNGEVIQTVSIGSPGYRAHTWNVKVTLNAPPTVSCTSSYSGPRTNGTSGNYYAKHTAYIINYNEASAKYGGTIKSIQLKLGSYSTTKTTNIGTSGSISVTPLVAGKYTPQIIITDSRGQTTTRSFSEVTYVAASAPNISSPLSTSTPTSSTTNGFWKGVSTASSAVSATSGINGGTISTVKITIGTQSGTRSGNGTVTSPVLSTAGSFSPVITVTDNYGYSSSRTLSSISVQTPTTSVKLDVFRINSSTDARDEEGTAACLKADFSRSVMSVGSTPQNYLLKPDVYVGSTSVTSNVTWYTTYSNTTGFSNPVNWTNYNPSTNITLYGKLTSQTFNLNNTYTIKITPKSTLKTGTQISDLLQAAFYLLAARAGGKGLGIGRKPSTNALYINMDTYFDLPVKSVIYMDNEMPIRSIIHRKKEDGGGWAYTPYIFQGDDGNPFAHIGAFGSADTHSYIFIGSNAYNGNNLRVNADGSIWTPAATVSSGGMSITGNIYIKPTSDAANSESFIQCYNNSSNDTITNYGCLGFMARSTVSGKPAYFAFWTRSPGTNSGNTTGRFYITETSVYTANSTPFTSAGKLTVSNATDLHGAQIYGPTNITGNLSATTINGVTPSLTDTHVKFTATTPANEITAYPLFYTSTASTAEVYTNANTRFWIKQGTASVVGYSYLGLGNTTADGTAGNSRGYLRLYGSTAYYNQIYGGAPGGNYTQTLPSNGSGTLINTAGGQTISGNLTITGSVQGSSSRNLINNSATSGQCHVGNSTDNLYLYGLTAGSSGSTLKTSGNRIYYDSSSKKYKHNIENLSDKSLDPKKLYDLDVRQFMFNDDFLTEEDERYHKLVVGLIAEEVYEKYPIAANLYKGEPEDWNERYIIPPMLKLIQEQHAEIEQLKKEVDELKSK